MTGVCVWGTCRPTEKSAEAGVESPHPGIAREAVKTRASEEDLAAWHLLFLVF